MGSNTIKLFCRSIRQTQKIFAGYIMDSVRHLEKAIQFVLYKLRELAGIDTLKVQADVNIQKDHSVIKE